MKANLRLLTISVGMRVAVAGREFECVAVEPYERKTDGAIVPLGTWAGECRSCVTAFTQRSNGVFAVSCDECRSTRMERRPETARRSSATKPNASRRENAARLVEVTAAAMEAVAPRVTPDGRKLSRAERSAANKAAWAQRERAIRSEAA